MDRETLKVIASQASDAMRVACTTGIYEDNGFEISPGFFLVYNEETGQSKTVIHHRESNLVFKSDSWEDLSHLSEMILGTVRWWGNEYTVRLPFHTMIDGMEVQEYIEGEPCPCISNVCEHAHELADVTNCFDTHRGNWKICDDEVILFDFESIIV